MRDIPGAIYHDPFVLAELLKRNRKYDLPGCDLNWRNPPDKYHSIPRTGKMGAVVGLWNVLTNHPGRGEPSSRRFGPSRGRHVQQK